MKKFLSLVLVLAMTMSLVTVSAGAKDFTDDSTITYKEAVDVMSAVGVVDGYTDGSFGPTSTLTRGAAAKIICNMILGPTNAEALSATSAPFADVPANHTFAGYIAYCAKEGIINGYDDGTFRPSGTLTGFAFMKMLLGALGYDSEIEGYTGSNWSINVAKQALNIDLDDGNKDFTGTKPVTREEACLYAFNTLKATMVEYESKTTVNVNGAEVNVGNQDAEDQEWSYIGAGEDGNIERDGEVQFAEEYFEDLKKVTSTAHDDFGRPATEWKYKSDSIGTYADNDDLEAAYINGVSRNEMYELIGKSIVDDIEDEDGAYVTVWVDGKEVEYEDGEAAVADLFVEDSSTNAGKSGRGVITEVYLDDSYNEDETMVTIVFIRQYLVQATADYHDNREELSIDFIDIREGDNDDLIYEAIQSDMPTAIEQDDFDVEDYVEDDYLLVTYSLESDEIESVTKAELLTGEVDTYRVLDYVVIGGETYKYSAVVSDTMKDETFDIGSEAVLVLDTEGHIIYVDEADASGNLIYIQEFDTSDTLGKQAIAAAYFTDGTYAEIDVDKVNYYDGEAVETSNDSAIGALGITAAGWYTYTTTSDGEYKLKRADEKSSKYEGDSVNYYATAGCTRENDVLIVANEKVNFLPAYESNKPSETYEYYSFATVMGAEVPSSEALGNSKTIFLVLDTDEDMDIYTGIDNVPEIYLTGETKDDAALRIAYVKENGDTYAEYVFIDASDLDDSSEGNVRIDESSSSDDYLFISAFNEDKVVKVDGDDNYVPANALVQGEDKVIMIEEGEAGGSGTFKIGRLYNKIKTDSNGYVTGGTLIEDDPDGDTRIGLGVTYSPDHSNKALKLGYDGSYTTLVLADDAVINLVMTDKALLDDEDNDYEALLNITGSKLESELNGYAVEYNWFAIMDDDGSDVIEQLYVFVYDAEEKGTEGGNNGNVEPTADEKFVAAAIEKVNNAEIAVTVKEGKAPAVANAVRAEIVKLGVEDNKANDKVEVISFNAATAGDGSVTTAEVKVTIVSGDVSDSTTITVRVTVDSKHNA